MRRNNIIMRIFVLLFVFISPLSKACANVKLASPLSELIILNPGEEHKGVLSLYNTTDEEQGVKIYQSDYFFNVEGQNFYDPPGSVARSNAKWISVDSKILTVSAKSKMDYPYTIKIPKDSSLEGSYWSLIMVEGVLKPKEEPKKGFQIHTVMRYAVQIVSNIKDSGKNDLTVLNKSVVKENEKTFLQIELENSGSLLISPKIQVDLFNVGTKEKKQMETEPRRIFPGTSMRYIIDVSDLEPGKYKSILLFDHGGDAVFGSQWDVEL